MPLDDSMPAAEARLKELSNARTDAQQMLQKRINNGKDPPKYDVNQKVWLDARNPREEPSNKSTLKEARSKMLRTFHYY